MNKFFRKKIQKMAIDIIMSVVEQEFIKKLIVLKDQ